MGMYPGAAGRFNRAEKTPRAQALSKAQYRRYRPGMVGTGAFIESFRRIIAKETADSQGQTPMNVRQAEVTGPVADPEKIMQFVVACPRSHCKPLGQRPAGGKLVGDCRSPLGKSKLGIRSGVRLIGHVGGNQVQVGDGDRYLIAVVVCVARIVHIAIVSVRPLHREVLAKWANDSSVYIEFLE